MQYQEAGLRRETLLRDRSAVVHLISRQPASDIHPLAIETGQTNPPPKGEEGRTAPPLEPSPPDGSKAPELGKSEFVREQIRSHPGITAGEIRAAAAGKFELKRTFPYTILFNWKTAEKIEERDGRYYPKNLS